MEPLNPKPYTPQTPKPLNSDAATIDLPKQAFMPLPKSHSQLQLLTRWEGGGGGWDDSTQCLRTSCTLSKSMLLVLQSCVFMRLLSGSGGLLTSQFTYLLFPSLSRRCGRHLDSVDSVQQLLSWLLSR